MCYNFSMDIKIICVGKLKEKFLKDGIGEFQKRIKTYANLEIVEVKDEACPENSSHMEMEKIKDIEGERILSKISKCAYVIALDISGKALTSEDFAKKIEKLSVEGISSIDFIIGGSLGLSKGVKNFCDYRLSFSKFTFPHGLMRLILVEQIYRAFRIINNHPYHK